MSQKRPPEAPPASRGVPERAELLEEYREAGQFERLNTQLAFNDIMVFLAGIGGAVTLFGNVPKEAVDLRVLTAIFGAVLSSVFLVSAERRAFRSRAIQGRIKEIEDALGLSLHHAMSAESRVLGLGVHTAALYRALFLTGLLVWVYMLFRTLAR